MRMFSLTVIATLFASIAAAQTPAPAAVASPPDAAAARRAASQENVKKMTEDKGYTQRAGDAAAKASGTGMSDEAKAKRQAASQDNVKKMTKTRATRRGRATPPPRPAGPACRRGEGEAAGGEPGKRHEDHGRQGLYAAGGRCCGQGGRSAEIAFEVGERVHPDHAVQRSLPRGIRLRAHLWPRPEATRKIPEGSHLMTSPTSGTTHLDHFFSSSAARLDRWRELNARAQRGSPACKAASRARDARRWNRRWPSCGALEEFFAFPGCA